MTHLKNFESYLRGPDCQKDQKAAMQHVNQVFKIWNALRDPDSEYSIDLLLNMDLLKEKWMTTFMANYQPGTTKSYLHSLVVFLEFVVSKKLFTDQSHVNNVIAALQRLSKRLRRKVDMRRTEVDVQDMSKCLLSSIQIILK